MKVILVDDEQLALDLLERQLVKMKHIEVVGKYVDPIFAKEKILQEENVDVIFLDINLPEINGIELAEQLVEKKPDITIVFVTAYNEYAVKAFELNALDYVVKPVRFDRLSKTITRIQEHLQFSEKRPKQTEKKICMNICKQVTIEDATIHWRTTKAQELFLYLLQNRGLLVRKSTLTDLLWPEFPPDKVYSQLYTTIYHVRKTLGQFGKHFHIKNTTEGYILNINNLILDVEEWEKRIQAAPPIGAKTMDLYHKIMSLYTGDYLQEYDYWWAESERQRLKRIWLHTSFQIADWYYKEGDMEMAISWYTKICNKQPEAEEAYFALMKIYAELGNQLLVKRHYDTLKNILMEELNIQPSTYISKWYHEWKKKIQYS
ncbi:response regulator [Bacillaceae bacterium Marseille-Q3522]|nr:response regulator [Bacillaceae bacterium Marseille-Q3522]